MSTHLPRLRRALLASGLATLILASAAQAANKTGADVRVVTADGKTLVDQRQYTGTTKVKTSPKADCFGDGTGGSGDKVEVPGSTALGAVSDASAYQQKLRPLLLTDSFDFGIGICGFGGVVAPQTGYWYLKLNHEATMTGGDQTFVEKGDDVLWYLIEDYNQPPPEELELKAPAVVEPGEKIPVRVFRYADDGSKSPAAGVKVAGAVTGADGTAEVAPTGASTRLQAVRSGDIPSRVLDVCQQQAISDCPAGHVLDIAGTDADDKIKGDKRPVVIEAFRGDDKVDLRSSKDSAPPIVKCGPGKDTVTVRDGQKFTARNSCERIRRR
jgi:hypothetical protein